MKQETSNKRKKWLLPVIALGVLIIAAGIVLALLLWQQGDLAGNSASAELYWNVDRESFIEEQTGMSTREKGEDGMYHMLFAYKGQQVELSVADKQLVNYIDQMDIVGLILDADGVIVDAVEPIAVATEAAKDSYVKKINGDNIVLNTSQAMNGMEIIVPITAQTGIYDVSSDAQLIGQHAECAIMDKVIVYTDADGNATHVYIHEHPTDAGVYWRVGRYYDSTNVCTTREPDENGVYTMLFAKDGEQLELKCRDKKLVNRIDSYTLTVAQMALLFDEEGYIIDTVDVALAIRGIYACQYYTVTAVNGSDVTVERIYSGTEQGRVKNFTISPDCDIFMCCPGCNDSHVGERTDHLKVGDYVNIYTDLDGKTSLIFVSLRNADGHIYYNTAQKYNSVTQETRREPDANGWYVFEMLEENKPVTVKTKDKQIANEIDSSLTTGLKLDGNVVVRTYPTRCITGNSTSVSGKYITSLSGLILTASKVQDFSTTANGILSPDCKIYDVTGDYGVELGSETTLQLYDRVFAFADIYNQISLIYVYSRYAEGTSVYYNLSRKYDTTNQVTTREPDAEGYYIFDMICDGKNVTVKTKSKSMATFMDAQSAPTMALKVSGGIVKEAHLAHMAVKYGYKTDNYVYVDTVKNGTYTTFYYSGDSIASNNIVRKIADNCEIYNVSGAYMNYQGEKTTLQKGDRIQAIVSNETGEAVVIFVISRELDSPMYYPVKQMYNSTTGETTRKPNAEGYYVFDLAVDGEIKQFKTADKAIASEVDAKSAAFVMITDGDIILRVCSAVLHKDVKQNAAGNFDVMAIDGKNVTLTRNRLLADNYGETKELVFADNCKIFDVCSYSENFGAAAELGLGDRVICYSNDAGEITYCYIVYKNTRKAGHVSLCEHCNKEVFWEPYVGTIYETDGHYYLPSDRVTSKQYPIGQNADYSICFDLNGKTLNGNSRVFLVYSELSIMDSAGGGVLAGKGIAGAASGTTATVYIGGTLNLYGGTLTARDDAYIPEKGGVVAVAYGHDTVFNMYGGAVTGGRVSGQGGNLSVSGGVFHMYGGTINGGTADIAGNNIWTADNSIVEFAGGTVTGDIVVGTGSQITVSGSTVITKGVVSGLKIAAGDIIKLGSLTSDASITVCAEGVFTEEKDNISSYQPHFKPFKSADTIDIEGNALAYVATPKDLNAVDNSPLSFQEGTTKAVCPVCEVEVSWTALTAEKPTIISGGHYYLAEDVTYTGTGNWYLLAPASGTACVHLNDHNITSPVRAIQGNTGVMYVMGNGIVSGNYTDSSNPNRGSTVDTTPSAASCNGTNGLNLLGGTYVQAEGNTQSRVASIWDNGGRINLYAGSTLSGGVYIGKANIVDAEFNIYGGSITGTVTVAGATPAKGNLCTLNLSGGNIAWVEHSANSAVTVSGTPTVSMMTIPESLTITLGEMADGANITVSANGVFTAENEDAASYAQYFHAAGEANGDSIVSEGNILVYVEASQEDTFDNSDLVFDDGKAVCPLCKVPVTWTALTSTKVNLTSGGHYYLAGDVTYTGTANWYLLAPGSGSACVHLNGHNLTSSTKAIQGNTGIVNFMGNGTVTGNFTDSANPNRGSTVDTTPSAASSNETNAINLYGGTYVQAAGNTQNSVVSIWTNGGRINLYEDAQIVGNVYVGRADILDAILSVNGGSITGTVNMAGANAAKNNICSLNLSGGTVDTVNVTARSTVTVSGTATVNDLNVAEGLTIQLGEMADGANITVSASGVFTTENENAASYAQYFHAAGALRGDRIAEEGNTLKYVAGTGEDAISPDANGMAYCAVCQEDVQWICLNNTADSKIGYKNDSQNVGAKYHYYLSGDLNCTSDNLFAERYYNSSCLHLNGYTLQFKAKANIGIGATLNILGSGNVIGSCDSAESSDYNTAVLYAYRGGIINLYGGTYSSTNTNAPAAMIGTDATSQINLYDDAVVNGGIYSVNGTVRLNGSSTVAHTSSSDTVMIDTNGKLVVANDWTGSATVAFTAALTDNMVPEKNGGCTGVFSGTLTNADGRLITGSAEGRLLVEAVIDNNPYNGELALDENGYASCPVCNEIVLWTGLSGSGSTVGVNRVGDSKSGHYYLADDVALSGAVQNMATAAADSTICLHLNGKNLTYGSRIAIAYDHSTINIMGSGNVSAIAFTGTAANNTAPLLVYKPGTLNLYGGTYSTSDATRSMVRLNHADGAVNIHDGVSITGGITVNKGTLTLSGGSNVDSISVATNGKLNICNDWTGRAIVAFNTTYTEGAELLATDAQCGLVTDGSFTPGGTFSGDLFCQLDTPVQTTGSDGILTVGAAHTNDNVLKILGIGNSYTTDSMYLLHEIWKTESPDQEILLGFLYYPACSLNMHASYLENNSAVYTYYKIDPSTGRWIITEARNMQTALLDEQWDIVTMQQSSIFSGKSNTYNSDIQTIQTGVANALGYTPTFMWNMTWAYAEGYSNSTYTDQSGTFSQAVMYEAICQSVQEKILTDSSFSKVIPTGTAIQNARTCWSSLLTSDAADTTTYALNRPDGTHLSDLGRVIAAYTWYCSIRGETPDSLSLTSIPSVLKGKWGIQSYTDLDLAIIAQAVRNAISTPYAVTDIND